MKGDVELTPGMIWSVLIFVSIVVATIFFLRSYYIDYAALLKTPEDQLKAVEAANAVKNCFQNGKPYVTEDFLNMYDGDDVDDICGFREPGTEANVLDVETDQKWEFDSNINEPHHSLWISIGYEGFDVITDENEKLDKEYVIHAKWRTGAGFLQANDIFIDIYPSGLYPGDLNNLEELDPAEVKLWIENLKREESKEGLGKVDFSGLAVAMNVGMIIPDGQGLNDCGNISPTLRNEACIRVSKGVEKIHIGRLHVKVKI
jgi:hypothetical protein